MGFRNTVTFVGNLTRDPELRFSQAGMPITTLGVAWNRRRPDGEDEVSFFNVVCFQAARGECRRIAPKGYACRGVRHTPAAPLEQARRRAAIGGGGDSG